MRALANLRRLLANKSGVAMIEFAMGTPLLLVAGLWGAETANFALVNMKIGQLAVHLADNASRIGDTSTLEQRKIYESDLNDLIYGAQIQGGTSLNLYENGRVFISSLEVGLTGNQYIHWQRCRGAKQVTSSYGVEGANLGSVGMGPTGEEVSALPGDAVIFVEINYTYTPLISDKFLGSREIKSIATFNVRDSRDLTQVYQRIPSSPDPVQTCSSYRGNVVISNSGVMS